MVCVVVSMAPPESLKARSLFACCWHTIARVFTQDMGLGKGIGSLVLNPPGHRPLLCRWRLVWGRLDLTKVRPRRRQTLSWGLNPEARWGRSGDYDESTGFGVYVEKLAG